MDGMSELWESAAARAVIAEGMQLLSGEMHGYRFDVVGSPLHS